MIDAQAGRTVPNATVQWDSACWLFFTSGTTGRPKAAVLTHGQMGFVITNHLCDLMPGATEDDGSLVLAPLSHGAGVHQLNMIARGGKTVLMPSDKFDAETAFALIEKHRLTNLFTVPTILKMLVEDPSVDRHDHSSLRFVVYAGAPMYRKDQKLALQKLGPVLVQYYGLAEATGNITVLPGREHDAGAEERRPGTCGFERTGMQVSIQDEAGNELEAGETGEICVVGPAVFAGYFENPEANAKSFRNGWFRTGDLGYRDQRRLHLPDRPLVGHVHLGRLQHLPSRDRGEGAHARGGQRGGDRRRARPEVGRGRRGGVRAARGRAAGRGRHARVDGESSGALQVAEAGVLLGGVAEVRLRQGPEDAGEG